MLDRAIYWKKCCFIYMLNSTTFQLPPTSNSLGRGRKEARLPVPERNNETGPCQPSILTPSL